VENPFHIRHPQPPAAHNVKEVKRVLVLSRKSNEGILINGDIKLTILKVSGNRVRLGIEAPPEVTVARTELDPHRVAIPTVPDNAVDPDAACAAS
jgi:carbon storage regulator